MTQPEKLAEFSRLMLGGREPPADLKTLLEMQWQGAIANAGTDPLKAMGVTLLEAGEIHPLLDHSYLNETNRADPDIMANVAAITSTCEHAAFVARNNDDAIFGYWFGPENLDIGTAPIVKLDSEGQFLQLEGLTLSEALLGNHVFEDVEKFAQLKGLFASAGIAISANSWDELAYPSPPTDPAEFHEQRYNENRSKAGLPPFR
jgi:hypothetical protein